MLSVSPSAFSGSWGCFVGAVSGSEVGGAVGPRWCGCTPCSARSGGAGWCHEEVHIPSAKTWEKDCGTSLKALQELHYIFVDRGLPLRILPCVVYTFFFFPIIIFHTNIFILKPTKICLAIDKLALCLLLSGTLRLEGTKSTICICVKSPAVAGFHSILHWW